VLSENMPDASNCSVRPARIVCVPGGRTTISASSGGRTVTSITPDQLVDASALDGGRARALADHHLTAGGRDRDIAVCHRSR